MSSVPSVFFPPRNKMYFICRRILRTVCHVLLMFQHPPYYFCTIYAHGATLKSAKNKNKFFFEACDRGECILCFCLKTPKMWSFVFPHCSLMYKEYFYANFQKLLIFKVPVNNKKKLLGAGGLIRRLFLIELLIIYLIGRKVSLFENQKSAKSLHPNVYISSLVKDIYFILVLLCPGLWNSLLSDSSERSAAQQHFLELAWTGAAGEVHTVPKIIRISAYKSSLSHLERIRLLFRYIWPRN